MHSRLRSSKKDQTIRHKLVKPFHTDNRGSIQCLICQGMEVDQESDHFWDDLLKGKVVGGPSTVGDVREEEREEEEEEELGRGMRARKEVQYYGQEKSMLIDTSMQNDVS